MGGRRRAGRGRPLRRRAAPPKATVPAQARGPPLHHNPSQGENLRLTSARGLKPAMRRSTQSIPTNTASVRTAIAYRQTADRSTRAQMVVLHETVFGMESAVQTFQTPIPEDEDQGQLSRDDRLMARWWEALGSPLAGHSVPEIQLSTVSGLSPIPVMGVREQFRACIFSSNPDRRRNRRSVATAATRPCQYTQQAVVRDDLDAPFRLSGKSHPPPTLR